MVKTVITYGTFDLFHIGHVNLLRRASELGERLMVGLSTDDFNAEKGKHAVFSYKDRAAILRSSRFVADVFPENTWEQKAGDIQRFNADVFVMGDDWAGKFDHLAAYCSVVYLSRTSGISSTLIKTNVFSRGMGAEQMSSRSAFAR